MRKYHCTKGGKGNSPSPFGQKNKGDREEMVIGSHTLEIRARKQCLIVLSSYITPKECLNDKNKQIII